MSANDQRVYAVLEDGEITNIVVADRDHAAEHGLVLVEGTNPEPGIGWRLVDGGWKPPPQNERRDADLATLLRFVQQHSERRLSSQVGTGPIGMTAERCADPVALAIVEDALVALLRLSGFVSVETTDSEAG